MTKNYIFVDSELGFSKITKEEQTQMHSYQNWTGSADSIGNQTLNRSDKYILLKMQAN